jgi:hypothetical protein
MSWRSVILVEEAGGPGENHRPVARGYYNNNGTGYDYPDLPGLGNNEKLGLPERLSTGIQFRFRNLFHGNKSGNRNFIY